MRTCLILLLIPILILGYAGASKVTVGQKDADYSNIQKAIDNSSSGDTIEVHSGVYSENIIIHKPLALIGVDSGDGRPLLDAGGSGSVISITANDVTLSGFNITGSGGCGCGNAGIKVESSNNTIKSNVIYKNKYGIYIDSTGTNNTFISNDLLNNSITVNDNGKTNRWNASIKAEGLQGLLEIFSGPQIKGNHYSDYDEDAEGCIDQNGDHICDKPRTFGSSDADQDDYPSKSNMN